MSPTTFIYALKDPTTGDVRYVGKANDVRKRLSAHKKEVRLGRKHHRANWLRSLLVRGINPVLEIIDEVPNEPWTWQAIEVAYIQFYRELGCDLVNTTRGGEGTGRGEDSPRFGKPISAAHRLAVSNAQRGVKDGPLSAERRAAISEMNKGRVKTVEWRAALSRAQKGVKDGPLSLAHRAKISAGNKGKTIPCEVRARIRATLTGHTVSLATRRAIGDALRRRGPQLQLGLTL